MTANGKTIADLSAVIAQECVDGNCRGHAVSLAYDDRLHGMIPVCRRHILAYRVSGGLWQAEDEWFDLRFARRSRFRWLAQRRILRDQRAAARGLVSRAQLRLTERADRAADLSALERSEVLRFGIHPELNEDTRAGFVILAEVVGFLLIGLVVAVALIDFAVTR